jgi:DNA-directed RNA polymerase specialized sigma24 family protein
MASSLCFLQDFSCREIAEVRHRPVRTARRRLHRGRTMPEEALGRAVEGRGVVRELTRERESA